MSDLPQDSHHYLWNLAEARARAHLALDDHKARLTVCVQVLRAPGAQGPQGVRAVRIGFMPTANGIGVVIVLENSLS